MSTIAAILTHIQPYLHLPVQLPTVNALLTCADIQVMFLQVQQCDFADLLSQGLVLWRCDGVAVSSSFIDGLRASVVGGKYSKHQGNNFIILLQDLLGLLQEDALPLNGRKKPTNSI